MCGLGTPELIIILVIALVIFGGSRLPQLGEGLGKAIRGFKKGMSDASDAASNAASKKEKEDKDSNTNKG
jgi:sec-independent protein translocase protein TatA